MYLHPSTPLFDLFRYAENIGCCLRTDRRGHLLVVPLPETLPVHQERHGTQNLMPFPATTKEDLS